MYKKLSSDRNEYEGCFNELFTPLCLFAYSYVGDRQLSKDIVQDVFMVIWKKKIFLKPQVVLKSYLYTSVKNKSLDYLKSKYHKTNCKLANGNLEALGTNDFFLREMVISEVSEIVRNAVKTLPPKCKKIIELSLGELSNKDIAEELSISLNAVKTQKRLAYKKLRPLLKEHFIFILPFL